MRSHLHNPRPRRRWALLGASLMAVAATSNAWGIQDWGAVASLFVVGWVIVFEFILPWMRKRGLRSPVTAHFTVRDQVRTLSGRDMSEGDVHLIKKLVVPANTTVDIEIGFTAKYPLHISEIVFGCGGKRMSRPYATHRLHLFLLGRTRVVRAKENYLDIHYHYHVRDERARNVGTHFVHGFRLCTRDAGLYPVTVALITDEIQGTCTDLVILVEDNPKTPVTCHAKGHGRACPIGPVTR